MPEMVTRRGSALFVGNLPFQFTGLNIYNAANTQGCWYTLGTSAKLGATLDAIGPGQQVFRTWFYQPLATVNGMRDWSSFDELLATARSRDERVIVALADQWGNCDVPNGSYKNEAWYRGGYRDAIGAGGLVTYRQWVADVVGRYRNNPTILAWQLMNEAEDAVSLTGRCSSTSARTLARFVEDMGRLVKSIDANHLLSVGTAGGGQCGAVGKEFESLHAIPQVDLCEVHDYGGPAAALGRGGLIAQRVVQCRAVGKPLFVGESGIRTGEVGSLAARAAAFKAKLSSQFAAGVSGVLVWDWADAGQAAYSGYEVQPGDPLLALLAETASSLGAARYHDEVEAPEVAPERKLPDDPTGPLHKTGRPHSGSPRLQGD